MIGEAADAIRSAWGEQIERDSMEAATREVGTAWVTDAGPRASARWVIHVAALDHSKRTSSAIVARATRAAIVLAEGRRTSALVYSALGTGAAEQPINPAEAGAVMARALVEYLEDRKEPSRVKDIVFVVLNPDTLRVFQVGLRKVLQAEERLTLQPQDELREPVSEGTPRAIANRPQGREDNGMEHPRQ